MSCLYRLSCFVVLCSLLPLAANAQVVNGSRGGAFIEAPRYIEQELRDAEESIEKKEYSDAVVRLGNLLQREMNEARDADLAGQDFFLIESGNSNSFLQSKSFLSHARKMLGELPPSALDTYELQFGALAQRMLTEASANRDWETLQTVRRKFFHTKAGYEASLILAQREILEGHPLSASLLLDAIVECPRAVNHLGPSVKLLHATASHLSERDIREFALDGGGIVNVGSKKVEWPAKDQAMIWIEDHYDIIESRDVTESAAYAFLGASANRNGVSSGQMPLSKPQWMVPTFSTDSEMRMISELERELSASGKLPAPSLCPIRVGDHLIMRTPDLLYGIDYKTGLRVWNYPWGTTNGEEVENSTAPSGSRTVEDKGPKQLLMQRIWNDIPFGQISSDGERVYMIDDLSPINYVRTNPALFGRVAKPTGERGNTLSAFELATEGKLQWEQGQGSDQASLLADAFFLGPPLPLDGRLYALVEMSGGDISVVCLDPVSGDELWRQQLIAVESGGIGVDPIRRIAGATPTYHEGVLICPTGAGATVAIDLADRTLRWGMRYATKSTVRNYNSRAPKDPATFLDRWHSGNAIAYEKSVLVTSIEADKLFCFDLLTGEAKFRNMSRVQWRYVAGARDGKFLLVGNRRIACYDVETGTRAWDLAANSLPSGSQIVGRGVFGEDGYYVPTSDNVILKVSLDDGNVVSRRKTQFPLGNLIAVGGDIISQSPTMLSCALGEVDLEPRVNEALMKNPNDVDNMVRKAQLLMQRNSREEAMKLLDRAWELRPGDDEVRDLSIEAMLATLREAKSADPGLIKRLDEAIQTSEKRAELLGLQISDAIQRKQHDQAIDHILRLSNLSINDPDVTIPANRLTSDNSRDFSLDSWITARVQDVWDACDDDQKQTFVERVAEIQKKRIGDGTSILTRIVKQFEPLDTADLIDELVDRLKGENRVAELERIAIGSNSIENIKSFDASRLFAVAKAQIAMRRGLDAQNSLASLKTSLSDDELTEQQKKDLIDLRAEVQQLVREPVKWGTQVELDVQTQQTRLSIDLSSAQKAFPTDHLYGDDFRGWRLSGAQDGTNLVMLDEYGDSHAVDPDSKEAPKTTSQPTAKIAGNIMVKVLPGIVSVYDLSKIAMNQPGELWTKDFTAEYASVSPKSDAITFRTTMLWYPMNSTVSGSIAAEFRVGPILGDRMIVLAGGDLLALDIATGEVIWRNGNAATRGFILADKDRLAVVSNYPKRTEVKNTLQYFSVHDGSLLETRPWEHDQVWHVSGKHVLTSSENVKDNTSVVELIDPFEDKVILEHNGTSGSRLISDGVLTLGRIESSRYMVLYDSNGRIVIWDIPAGTELADLETQKCDLARLYVIDTEKHIIVLPSHLTRTKDLHIVRGNSHRGAHAVYAVSKETGELAWEADYSKEGWGCTIAQPYSSPVLMLSRYWSFLDNPQKPRKIDLQVRAINAGDGEVLVDRMGLELPSKNPKLETRVNCEPARRRVIVRVDNQILTYKFGDGE